MIDVIRAGVAVGLAVALPFGPVGLTVVALGRRGWRSGAAAAGGVAAADLTWAVAAVAGGAVLGSHPAVRTWRIVADAVLVAIGLVLVLRGARALRRRGADSASGSPPPVRSARRWFATLYGLTLPNPLTVAVFTAAAVDIGGGGLAPRAVFVAAVGLASLAWQLVLAATGRHVLGRTGPAAGALLTVAGGLLLVMWPLTH